MSILLDSLRKSEAQRRVGDAPSIHSTQESSPPAGGSKQWLALAMMGVTAAAIVWFGWQQYADPESSASAPSQAAVETGEVPTLVTSNKAQPGQATQPEVSEPAGGEARTPVEQLSQQPGGRGSGSPVGEDAPPSGPENATPADRIAGFTAEERLEDPAAADETPAPELVVEDTPAEAAPPEEAIEELARVERGASQRRSRVEPPESEPLSYWQLPQSVRNDLPEFTMTVLVYAEAPEDRFLLINGKRLQEGENLEGGVVLEEIRRDGAVFSYRQYRFLVTS